MAKPIEPFGVYVHFPWCLSKCPYCDFASRAAPVIPHARYADAVLAELRLRAVQFPSRPATSVYFGGGTPSLWAASEVARVLHAIRDVYPFAPDAELTIEANPGAADASRFAAFREAGFNRLSIGAQSFQPEVLGTLGRRHTPGDVVDAVKAGRAARFENISVDIIYGAPGHTVDRVRDDAKSAVDLGTDHISAYALTLVHLAEDVPMARDWEAGRISVPDDDRQAEMGEVAREVLSAAGFRRYEISNYARAGRESQHNLNYWRGGGYLALGVGASGFAKSNRAAGGVRYSNKRAPDPFMADIESGEVSEKDHEEVDAADVYLERIFTGLRLAEGLDLAQLDALCGTSARAKHGAKLERFAADGFIAWDGQTVTLTTKGMELHTSIATELSG